MDSRLDNRMTVQEIAAVLGVSASAVYQWANRGRYLEWHRSSNNRFFALRDEVMEFAKGYIGRGRSRESATS